MHRIIEKTCLKFRKYAMNKGKNKEKGADILAYYTGKMRKDCRK